MDDSSNQGCCAGSNKCSDSSIKELVKEGYSKISTYSKQSNVESLCGIGRECKADYSIFSEDYSKIQGYCESADLGLGCGIPTSSIQIKEGNYVLDLGCGAGNDCFVAREMVGETGKVIGLDMTPNMLRKAWENNDKMNYRNVEFRLGDIEDMPVANELIDVVISNCVINLVPNKIKAFKEIYRVLKTEGIFSISDIVISKELPKKIKEAAELIVGCVSGAIQKETYLKYIHDVGFSSKILKEKEINIPESILKSYLSDEEIAEFKLSGTRILSITVVGLKNKI